MHMTQIVRGTQARITEVKAGNIWYCIKGYDKDYSAFKFDFPVPIEDTEGLAFKSEMKSIELMKWVRNHLDLLKEAKK